MKTCRVPAEEAIGKCSWCGKTIPEDTPVFAFGGKKRPGLDLSEFEGGAIRVSLATEDREVVAIIPGAGSQARRDGHDLMFMVCSESCGAEMKATMQNEVCLGDALFGQIEKI